MKKFNLRPCMCGNKNPIIFKNCYALIFKWQFYCDECGWTGHDAPTRNIAAWLWNHLRQPTISIKTGEHYNE